MDDFAKVLILLGVGLALVGAVLFFAARLPGVGNLPGTFVYQSGGLSCVAPVLASILLSIVLTVVLNVVIRLLGK